MKKVKPAVTDELREEYRLSDFKKLERGKYFERARKGSNIVVLDPQIAKAFPTSDAVNAALSGLLDLAKKSTRRTSGRS